MTALGAGALKFIYSEKATTFWEIFTNYLTGIGQIIGGAFSEYMNFKKFEILIQTLIFAIGNFRFSDFWGPLKLYFKAQKAPTLDLVLIF